METQLNSNVIFPELPLIGF